MWIYGGKAFFPQSGGSFRHLEEQIFCLPEIFLRSRQQILSRKVREVDKLVPAFPCHSSIVEPVIIGRCNPLADYGMRLWLFSGLKSGQQTVSIAVR